MYSKNNYRDFMEENFFLLEDVQFKKISYLEYLENNVDT